MNKARRKQIEELIEKLFVCYELVEEIAGDERDYYDNMPENLQDSERGMRAEEVAGMLEEARDSLDEAKEKLEEASE